MTKFTEEYEQMINEGPATYMFSMDDFKRVSDAVRSVRIKDIEKAVDIPGEILDMNNSPKLLRFTAGGGPTMTGYVDVFYRDVSSGEEESHTTISVNVDMKSGKINEIKLIGVIR